MKVFVCAGMGLAKNENINRQAVELGKMLAENQALYVQGGSDEGLMGLTLKEFVKYSKNVMFVIPSCYYDYDAPKLLKMVGVGNFKFMKVASEAERLKVVKACDKVIVLPGGTGTIEELLYCNETARAKEHSAEIYLVNIDGYFDGLMKQISTNIKEGLSKPSAIKFHIVNHVKDIQLQPIFDEFDDTMPKFDDFD